MSGDKLSMNTFIARGQGSVNFRTPTNMFELAVFLNMFFLGLHIELASTKEEVDAAFVITRSLGSSSPPTSATSSPLGRQQEAS